jgi:N utilization substance protein A
MNKDFIGALSQMETEKGLSKDILIEAIEAALVSAYRKNFGKASNVQVHIDDSGDVKVIAQKMVVEDVEDPLWEIALIEARSLRPTSKLGDEIEIEVTPKNFGRIAAQTAKQVVVQRLREAEREMIFDEYKDR